MNILIQPGCHNYHNVGDISMLQVTVQRLRALWPEARMWVLTADEAGLRWHVPEAEPVRVADREAWFEVPPAGPEVGLRDRRRMFAANVQKFPPSRSRIPPARRKALGLVSRRAARVPDNDFLSAIMSADLFVLSGMGSLNNVFQHDAKLMLESVIEASELGIPSAALSQGLGPLDPGTSLWDLAGKAIAGMNLVGLREGVFGPALLNRMNIAPSKFVVTGDDSIVYACGLRASGPHHGIGINLRVAPYSMINDESAQRVGGLLLEISRSLGTYLRAVPIAFAPWESDLESIDRVCGAGLVDEQGISGPDVEASIRAAGSCRVVVTGSYHAAVFALSQGVPAICIENSEYYRQKFLGLAALFGEGTMVLSLSDNNFCDALRAAVEELHAKAGRFEKPLKDAAARQASTSRAAYNQIPARIGRRSRLLG